MQRNNLVSTSTKNNSSSAITVVTISFATEKDRVKGVATLIRSPYAFKGIDKNKFIIEKEHLKIFRDTDIEYRIL